MVVRSQLTNITVGVSCFNSNTYTPKRSSSNCSFKQSTYYTDYLYYLMLTANRENH